MRHSAILKATLLNAAPRQASKWAENQLGARMSCLYFQSWLDMTTEDSSGGPDTQVPHLPPPKLHPGGCRRPLLHCPITPSHRALLEGHRAALLSSEQEPGGWKTSREGGAIQ